MSGRDRVRQPESLEPLQPLHREVIRTTTWAGRPIGSPPTCVSSNVVKSALLYCTRCETRSSTRRHTDAAVPTAARPLRRPIRCVARDAPSPSVEVAVGDAGSRA